MVRGSRAGMADGCSRNGARWGLLLVWTVSAWRIAGFFVVGFRHAHLMWPSRVVAGIPLKFARTPSCRSFRTRPLGLFRLRMVTATVPPGSLVTVHAASDTRVGVLVAAPAPAASTATASAVPAAPAATAAAAAARRRPRPPPPATTRS